MLSNPCPEIHQALASAIAPALHPAVTTDHRVYRPGAAAAQSLELDARILEQCVQHAPGKCPVRPATLKRKVESGGERAPAEPALGSRPRI